MMMIPVAAVAAQSIGIVLAGQNCRINISQKSTGVFLDLLINDSPIARSVICLDRVKLIRYGYRGFAGNLVFIDKQGVSDPDYTGFGTRYVLAYLDDGEA